MDILLKFRRKRAKRFKFILRKELAEFYKMDVPNVITVHRMKKITNQLAQV